MQRCPQGVVARAVMVLAVVVLTAGAARAAGEWEWTQELGWSMGAGVSRPTPKEQLHYAYELEQRGEFMDAARQYFLLVQNFPESQEAGIGLQRLARCLFEMENYYTSYKAIEQVIETYPNTGRMSDLVEIELRVAKKMMVSQTPDILSGRNVGNRDFNIRRALEIVDSVIEHDPYGPVAAEAYLVKGEGNLFLGEINTARTAFETVRDEFPRSDYVERARLGIVQCDNLVGQATPQELMEQIEVVRESEAQRQQQGGAFDEDLDEVEGSIRQLAEVEAAKMMEQAEQYRRMGTRAAVKSSEFLYNEIVRRYPSSPQAEEAMDRLGTIKMPKEEGRVAKTFRHIKLNPFSWNKDPEPPWKLPQMDPEEMVMVDPALGPILGVPETGMVPQTAASAGVRPARLPEQTPAELAGGDLQGPAMPPLDASGTGGTRTYSSAPTTPPPYPEPAPYNPIPTISDDDLIPMGGMVASAGRPAAPPAVGYPASPSPAPLPDLSPDYGQPTLNYRDYNTPMSDLVGPARRQEAPLPEYGASGLPPAGYYDNYQTPQAAPYDPYAMQQPAQSYDPYAAQPQASPYPEHGYSAPYQSGGRIPATGYGQQSGGWTLEDDFR